MNVVTGNFNKLAKDYDKVAVLQQRIAAGLLSRLNIINISPHIILDVGASTGYGSRLLTKQFKTTKILSVDLACNMLKIAKKQKKLFSKQRFICADLNALPLPDNSIDFIFSNLMLHWSADIDKTFQEWQRVLKSEGLLLFSTYGPDTLLELRHSWAEVDDQAHVPIFLDMHDVGDKLMRAGFSNPVLDVENYQLTFATKEQLMQELENLGLHDLGNNKLDQMLQAYEQFKLKNNQYPASYEVVYGHAWGTDLSAKQKISSSGEVVIPISKLRRP